MKKNIIFLGFFLFVASCVTPSKVYRDDIYYSGYQTYVVIETPRPYYYPPYYREYLLYPNTWNRTTYIAVPKTEKPTPPVTRPRTAPGRVVVPETPQAAPQQRPAPQREVTPQRRPTENTREVPTTRANPRR
jgi:hypothetical protein